LQLIVIYNEVALKFNLTSLQADRREMGPSFQSVGQLSSKYVISYRLIQEIKGPVNSTLAYYRLILLKFAFEFN